MFDASYLKGETWGFPGQSVEQVETHAAHVFLVGNRAFKIKKPIKLPYLDFSSREKRLAVLNDEFAINRVFAPDIYLFVTDVLGEPVLVMRRFPAYALLSWKMAHDGISEGVARRLADMVVEAHAAAPQRNTAAAGIMMGLGAQLSKAFIDSPDIFQPAATLEFHALYEDALSRSKMLLNRRGEDGLVRRCHGDMHAGNIIVEDGTPKLFDAIEFSEKIATIDVLYDLAFLLMDLWTHDEKRAANIILNRYLHLRRREEDLSGLALLPLFLSTRAGVRALVSADLAHELPLSSSMKPRGQALDWFRASIAFLKPARPCLVCIGGLSGTGKSTLAAGLASEIGGAPGALHVRSDVERKVLAGVADTHRLPTASYSREASAAVYNACLARTEKALAAGHSVVLDAVFAHAIERSSAAAAAALASKTGADFHGFWLEATEELLKSRVTARKADASDATADVVEKQLTYRLGPMDWHRVDASHTPAETLAAVRERLRCPSAGPA
ncbi:AAA family ATPase [Aestuariivirga sp.]|uniref:bifunctional aminoglycoside phosphotransferase/ATP-binding protein n=1 Tax=Aestuariivirga sp. TaxID=2650926 RepID=UPI0035940EFF